MAEDTFGPPTELWEYSGGIYLAEVVNHLDQTYMGFIEVLILNDLAANTVANKSNTVAVRYMSPFSGVTSARFEGNNSGDFNDVQKSYGMWMVPPDVGTTVLVIFPTGSGTGFWIGCVSDMFQNHMIPGIAASENVAMTSEQQRRYGTNYLPVAEFSKKTNKGNNQNISKLPKPVHPFADRLLQQGLILDTVRGVTSSSARREIPSQVFGISTPGPVDTSNGAPRGKIGFDGNKQFPISRLGGSTFVMDDGDQAGNNELMRIRTRTGHQILLHNSADLIYIANAKGTAWMEFTSNGKIDIYAADSVSIHTKGDFNLRADRDFNLEAGRNFNISTAGDFNLSSSGNMSTITANVKSSVSGDYSLSASGSFIVGAGANVSTAAGAENKHAAAGKLSLSGATAAVAASGQLSVSGGSIIAAGGSIDLNGAAPDAPNGPDSTSSPMPLQLFKNPQSDPSVGWSDNRYKGADIISIMQRIPSHEPWAQHESVNPAQFTLQRTDSTNKPQVIAENGEVIPADASAAEPYAAKPGPSNDQGTVRKQPFPWSTDQPFLTKVKEVAGRLKFDPILLLGCMYLESAATMDPAIDNNNEYEKTIGDPVEHMGFVGLIQFGHDACVTLKTTKAQLIALSRVQQMDWVEKYFRFWGWPNNDVPNPTIANIYLTILLPARRFFAPDQKVAEQGNPKLGGYKSNSGFDKTYNNPPKGYFTADMVAFAVQDRINSVKAILAKAGVGADLVVPGNTNTKTVPSSSANNTPTGGIVVVGDSIAKGTGEALQKLKPGVIVSARVGAPSSEILNTWAQDKKVQNASVAVVSAGSNDIVAQYPDSQTPRAQTQLKTTLEKIRSTLNAKKYIWILPNFKIANQLVLDFATAHGDQTVSFVANTVDNVHPSSYYTVAKDVQSQINP
jgi:hypothetical protein